jgi:hypothetical protein
MTKVVVVLLVLGLVAGAESLETCPLYLLECVAVLGGMIRRMPWAAVHDARLIQHWYRIEFWLVPFLALVVVVAAGVATSVTAKRFGVVRAGLTGVCD